VRAVSTAAVQWSLDGPRGYAQPNSNDSHHRRRAHPIAAMANRVSITMEM
jgi:hypothetical protein